MQNGILLEQENKQLRAANATQKQKRARKNRWIAHDNGLSVREALELKEAHEEPSQAILAPPSLLPRDTPAPKTRRPPQCTNYGQIGHKRNSCKARD